MTDVFILQNSDDLYLDRQGEWVSGGEAASLYRSPHKDEAINQMVEVTVRHPELRIRVIQCHLDDRGRPSIAPPDRPTLAEPVEEPPVSEASD